MSLMQKIIWTIYFFVVLIVGFDTIVNPVGGICSDENTFCQVGIGVIHWISISMLVAVPTYILHWIWKEKKK